MKKIISSLRLLGYVQSLNHDTNSFTLQCNNGEVVEVFTNGAWFHAIKNLDGLDRTRLEDKGSNLKTYLTEGTLVSTYGVYQIAESTQRYDAKEVTVFKSYNYDKRNKLLFEEKHWWLNQISCIADKWISNVFDGNKFDYSSYQTNLSLTGEKEEDDIQVCATLARLIYGFSSAYLMTGNELYFKAAEKGVEYQRNYFRTVSDDGAFIIWAFGYKDGKKIMPSNNTVDKGTIPLYEQIYALSGLTQFYRITKDWETLQDITQTIELFNQKFKDTKNGGYFSHIDYATLSHDSAVLEKTREEVYFSNRNKKNWNSVGDHSPAYLLNLMLSLTETSTAANKALSKACTEVAEHLSDIIVSTFIVDSNDYVIERFTSDWTPDLTYDWQQNRAIVGHNLKIVWNITRSYNAFGKQVYLEKAEVLAQKMLTKGMDQVRGGWYDAVERVPENGMDMDFPWHNRKAWWQQEQAILAFLILYGATKNEKYLKTAQESIAFWNLAFLDHQYGGVFFEVTDDGLPYIIGDRSMKGNTSKSGYHVCELNYLAHIYIRTFVTKDSFRLYFKVASVSNGDILNVLPDYLGKSSLSIQKVLINGDEISHGGEQSGSIALTQYEGQKNIEVVVEFLPNKS